MSASIEWVVDPAPAATDEPEVYEATSCPSARAPRPLLATTSPTAFDSVAEPVYFGDDDVDESLVDPAVAFANFSGLRFHMETSTPRVEDARSAVDAALPRRGAADVPESKQRKAVESRAQRIARIQRELVELRVTTPDPADENVVAESESEEHLLDCLKQANEHIALLRLQETPQQAVYSSVVQESAQNAIRKENDKSSSDGNQNGTETANIGTCIEMYPKEELVASRLESRVWALERAVGMANNLTEDHRDLWSTVQAVEEVLSHLTPQTHGVLHDTLREISRSTADCDVIARLTDLSDCVRKHKSVDNDAEIVSSMAERLQSVRRLLEDLSTVHDNVSNLTRRCEAVIVKSEENRRLTREIAQGMQSNLSRAFQNVDALHERLVSSTVSASPSE